MPRHPALLQPADSVVKSRRREILHVAAFASLPILPLRDDGPNPSRQSACFPHELCGAGDCLDERFDSFAVDSASQIMPVIVTRFSWHLC